MEQVEKQVIEIITGVLKPRNEGVLIAGSSMMGDPREWDSMAFVEIFLAVSGHFDLEVSDDDAISFMSVPEIVGFVSERV
jgi:acyl carrier protein